MPHCRSGDRLFHDKIGEQDSTPYHLLFPEGPIAPVREEGPGGDGGVGGKMSDAGGRGMAFQCVAERGGGPAGLEMPVDKKPIQISAAVHVPEADDQVSVQRHQGVVFPQCVVPAGCVHGPGRPGPELFRGVVSGVDRVYGFKKRRVRDSRSSGR